MASSDNLPIESGKAKPIANSPVGLPGWAAVLPLWASAHWLWLAFESIDVIRYWTGTEAQALDTGQGQNLGQLPFTIPYSFIILDIRRLGEIPADWWPHLERLLAPGGLLLICHRRDKCFVGQIRSTAPELYPG